jgi:hypothetical protein
MLLSSDTVSRKRGEMLRCCVSIILLEEVT